MNLEVNKNDLFHVYVVDEGGYVLSSKIVSSNESLESNLVKPFIPSGLYKPKWTGIEWIEGATPEEIEELTRVEPSPPTAEERIDALEEALLLMMMEG